MQDPALYADCRSAETLVLPPCVTVSMPDFPLSKLTHQFGEHVIDKASGQEVFHVNSSHVLIQAAGYLKHNLALIEGMGVYFRGQTRLYDEITPSLFRGIGNNSNKIPQRRDKIDELIDSIYSAGDALRSVDRRCAEPLLQHYGVRTTWLDVVDNIWVAIWFACNDAISYRRGEYLHFEPRIPDFYRSGEPEYAYVLLIASANQPADGLPGHFASERSETVDLRIAAPSHFVRPHAQHGLLVRRLSKTSRAVSDMSPLHVGTIRIDLPAALEWLGSASTLTTHSLFPPAYYDYGYRELLDHVSPIRLELGAIHRIQP